MTAKIGTDLIDINENLTLFQDPFGGETLVEDVFAARRRQAETRLRARMEAALPSDAPLEDRVRELARLQDEYEYVGIETCAGKFRLHLPWRAPCAVGGTLEAPRSLAGDNGAVKPEQHQQRRAKLQMNFLVHCFPFTLFY